MDVCEENVVVVGRKTVECQGPWEKFEVGPSAEQTVVSILYDHVILHIPHMWSCDPLYTSYVVM